MERNLMEEINDQVKDNARELQYIAGELKKIRAKQDKNDQCHADIKTQINKMRVDVVKVKGDLSPVKKIVWIGLSAMVIGLIGGAIALLYN